MQASIQKSNLVDTHKDARFNDRHFYKSEMPIDTFTVLSELEKLGYSALDYSEQGYDRVDQKRVGHGYYTVNLTSNKYDNVGICLIDAKDGQSSMKLYAGVLICDRVFPMVLITEIKHRQHDSYKVESLSDTLRFNVSESVETVVNTLKLLRATKLDSQKANLFAMLCANVRRNHRNYGVTRKMVLTFDRSTSALNVFTLSLATLADVAWTRHFITLSLGITEVMQGLTE